MWIKTLGRAVHCRKSVLSTSESDMPTRALEDGLCPGQQWRLWYLKVSRRMWNSVMLNSCKLETAPWGNPALGFEYEMAPYVMCLNTWFPANVGLEVWSSWKKWVSKGGAWGFISSTTSWSLCFLIMEVIWPTASHICHDGSFVMIDHSLLTEGKNKPFIREVDSCQIYHHSSQRSN